VEKLKIYLGDITYDTVSLSTEAIPLAIGYVAAYCKKVYGSQVEITLFKYLEEMEQALIDSPPDIIGFSNYTWNQNIGIEMFKLAREQNPNILTVWGGPNYPIDFPSQQKFMNEFSVVDIYVPLEGEIGFSNIIKFALTVNQKNNIRNYVIEQSIDGCVVRDKNNILQLDGPGFRTKALDDIPSPYLTGLFDKFFDGRLSPLMQTNRGCPFQCTFCTDGVNEKQQVNQFSMERVLDEIEYVGKHLPKKTSMLMLADLNFGMMPRDRKICEALAESQKKYNYPRYIDCSTGKNSKDKIIEALSILNGALQIKLSVQSTDEQVMINMKRDNISTEQMLELTPALRKNHLPSMTEIIVGLPGDTLQSNIKTIKDMMRVDVDQYLIYTLMLLHGSELNTPQEREKWGFKTKFRILPRSFTKLQSGKKVMEIEEVVVSSNTLHFEDYVKIRLLAFSIFVTNQPAFKPIIKFLRQNNVEIFDLFNRPLESENTPDGIKKLFNLFNEATVNELWDSPEEIIENFQDETEYQKLLNDELGFNVIQFHQAIVTTKHMHDWTEYVISLGKTLLRENNIYDESKLEQYDDVANYCRGLSYNVMALDNTLEDPEFRFKYDISTWSADPDIGSKILEEFQFDKLTTMKFIYTKEEIELFNNNMNIYGTSTNGIAQLLKRLPRYTLWRHAFTI
tara:strand:+ start:1928 stop:3964 length:2037 start_codon:yes stop_codon:yes gene_type:complete